MSYDGGKGGAGVYQQIINLMPPHNRYIEVCLGAGSILRAKRPASESIGVELDPAVLAAWRGNEVPRLTLLRMDALEFLNAPAYALPCALPEGFQEDDLVYVDPPYVRSARRSQRPLYAYEFTDEQHRELLRVLNMLDCMVMISGYACPLYVDFFASANADRWRCLDPWRCHSFTTTTRGGGLATECVWMNFPEPLELHDYRYLGNNFRERQRIKRKKQRWLQRLMAMPTQERHAMMGAVEEWKTASLAEASGAA